MSSKHVDFIEQEHEFLTARLEKLQQHFIFIEENEIYDESTLQILQKIDVLIDRFLEKTGERNHVAS